MTEIITFSITKELREKVDRQRGDIARSKFISRLLEDALRKYMKENQFPTMTGQSLARPGQSVGEKSTQGSEPTDG
jgi:hypothetical protein